MSTLPRVPGAALGLPFLLLLSSAATPPTLGPPPPSSAAAAGVAYVDVTARSGLLAFRQVSGGPGKDYILEVTGSGVALFDFDGDGWLDVYLVNGSTFPALRGEAAAPSAALYRNNRDGTFADVAEAAGVANRAWGQGSCVGDIDNDGRPDLYVTNFGPNRLYHNEGGGRFTDIAARAQVALGSWSTGCAFGDYDGDGLLDLFVAGYVALDLEKLPPAPPAQAARGPAPPPEKGTTRAGMGAAYSPGAGYCEYRGQPAMCGPRGLRGAPDHLFRNRGDGTFEDVSVRAGVADAAGLYGFGVAFLDFDDDGRLDLFVANDSTPNSVYRNRGDGTFQDTSYASGAAFNEAGQEQAHMGVAVGDYDRDGRDDLHVTNFADDTNILYRNEGGGLFTEATFPAGVGTPSLPFLGWGTHFLDYDNDGWLDLFVANGHVYPFVDRFDWNTSYRQRSLLFRNLGGRFAEVTGSAGDGLAVLRSMRGSAAGDLDNDGDLDLVVNALDDSPLVLRNDGGNRAGHWLTVRLVGDPGKRCPRDAIGSVVFLGTGKERQRGEVASGRSQVSQSDLRVHFGLGSATRVDRLEVRWANGPTTAYEVGAVDREIVIDQALGVVEALAPASQAPGDSRDRGARGRGTCEQPGLDCADSRDGSQASPDPTGLPRCLPGLRDAPDDGRGPALLRGGGGAGRVGLLGLPLSPPGPRGLGGRLAARHDPAVVLVPGGGRAALLPRRPQPGRAVAGAARRPRVLARPHPDRPRRVAALHRPSPDLLHLRGHAEPDRPGLRVPVPAGPAAGTRPMDRPRRGPRGLLGRLRPLPRPGPGFDWNAVGVPPDWPHHPRGFAAHWDLNSNLAWAFDVWFMNLFPRESPFLFNGGGYSTLSFIPTLGTMILGLLAGGVLRNDRSPAARLRWLVTTGLVLVAFGWLLGVLGLCPVVKRIWTPSFTLWSGGICLLFLAAFHWVLDLKGHARWAFPLVVIGANSIAAYCMDHLFREFVASSLLTHLGPGAFRIFGDDFVPLLQGAAVLIVLWLILLWMYRRRIFLRI